MDLKELQNKLSGKYKRGKMRNKAEIDFRESRINNFRETKGRKTSKKPIIIGVTGSKGKSSVCLLIHKYLKEQGYRSVLYCSASIDSPARFSNPDIEVDYVLYNEEVLYNLLNETEIYEADFLVLEVNERSIERGLIKDIPFDVRILTNIIDNHNLFYTNEEYISLKEKFFKDISPKDKSIAITGMTPEMTNAVFDRVNNHHQKKVLFGSNYVVRNIRNRTDNFDYLLTNLSCSLDGMKMSYTYKNEVFKLESAFVMPYSAFNILAAIAALEAIGEFDYQSFKEFIKGFKTKGRDEVIYAKDRVILISRSIAPQLELLKELNKKRLVLVGGTNGDGFKSWKQEFSKESVLWEKEEAISYATNYINKYADYLYLTTNDNAALNPKELLARQARRLIIPFEEIDDRKEAIKKAIRESRADDVIFISGRGNRDYFCKSANHCELYFDKDIVLETLKELKLEVENHGN